MKLNITTDFTKFPKAVSVVHAGEAGDTVPFDIAVLPHDERHLRRRAIGLQHGDRILVDLPKPVVLDNGDRLVLEDGRHVEIIAAEEEVYDIRARDAVHLAELAWHIGNRHLAAAIEPGRILILRDHVIKEMLEGLGALVTEIVEPFEPVRGAYSGHDHGHDHSHVHDHDDDHDHGHGRIVHHHHEDDDYEPDHGSGRVARARSSAASADHDHDDERDHGAGRIARRKAPAQPAKEADPDHGAGRAAEKRGKPDRYGRLPGDPHYGHNHD